MSSIFLDSSSFFDYLENRRVKRTLNHCDNDNHLLATSNSVIGEVVIKCWQRDELDRLKNIFESINRNIDLQFVLPMTESADKAGQFSNCRFCVEQNYLDESTYGSSASDRTHLAFAIAFGFDYFLLQGMNHLL